MGLEGVATLFVRFHGVILKGDVSYSKLFLLDARLLVLLLNELEMLPPKLRLPFFGELGGLHSNKHILSLGWFRFHADLLFILEKSGGGGLGGGFFFDTWLDEFLEFIVRLPRF